MKHILYILLCCGFLLGNGGCTASARKTNWKIEYSFESKDPYGFFLFHEMIPHMFAQAKIHHTHSSANIFAASTQGKKSVYVMLAGKIGFDEPGLIQLDDWVYEGNDVIMIANEWDEEFMKALPFETIHGGYSFHTDTGQHIVDKVYTRGVNGQRKPYQTRRMFYDIFSNYWQTDSAATSFTEIAWDDKGNATAVALQIGDGKLIMATNFLACSNYFLLQGNNHEYISDILSYASKDATNVYVMVAPEKHNNRSDWSVLWSHKATRAAILLSLMGLLVYVLFGLKRKQKVIPQVAPLTNDAASFAATIASLYYNTRNNRNLAQKMIQHFLEHVRTGYQLPTNTLDEAFVEKLSLRSGIALAATQYLFSQIRQVQENSAEITDSFLHSLYKNIQAFYKK